MRRQRHCSHMSIGFGLVSLNSIHCFVCPISVWGMRNRQPGAYDLLRGRNNALLGRGYYLYVPGFLLELVAISYCNSIPYPLVHNGLFPAAPCSGDSWICFGWRISCPASFRSPVSIPGRRKLLDVHPPRARFLVDIPDQ